MSIYTPSPGSVADVVIEHLKKHGGTLTAAQIHALTACDLSNVSTNLRKAVDAKYLEATRAHGSDGRKYAWQLGPKAVAGSTNASITTEPAAEAAATDALQIVTYDDGDVVVNGYREVEGGGVIFTRAQMQQLVLRMTRPHIDTATEA